MVVVEVALAVVLLVGAGLLTKSFIGLVRTDPGFEPDGLVTVSLELPEERYGEEEAQRAFTGELRRALGRRGADGLDEVALTSSVPSMASVFFGSKLEVEGRGRLPEGSVDLVSAVAADPGYFRTLGTHFLEGGPFGGAAAAGGTAKGAGHAEEAEQSVVVNRALARALWPAGDALGGRFRMGFSDTEPWMRVVGIVEDVAQLGLSSTHDTFQLYWPLHGSRRLSVVARADGLAPELVGERVAAAVHAIDPWLPVPPVRTATELLGRSVAHQRFEMTLMLAFAAVALALTVLGVYAVLAYAVRLRAFEIGVRSALGARPGQVLGLIARQGGLLIGSGLLLGLGASIALGRLIESQLHGVATSDPTVMAGTVVVLAAATAVATLVPARRAARLDPARVLRTE
jgi:predicted permease